MRKISLNVKTFFGKRQKINILIDIKQTVLQLKTKILEKCEETSKNFYNIKLIYPMVCFIINKGHLMELEPSNTTLHHFNLPNDANLIMLVNTTFTWNPATKGNGIKVDNFKKSF